MLPNFSTLYMGGAFFICFLVLSSFRIWSYVLMSCLHFVILGMCLIHVVECLFSINVLFLGEVSTDFLIRFGKGFHWFPYPISFCFYLILPVVFNFHIMGPIKSTVHLSNGYNAWTGRKGNSSLHEGLPTLWQALQARS